MRAPNGTITTFDAPGAVFSTEPVAINPMGTITGLYFDASGVGHGFVRALDGTFTTFDVPGALIQIPTGITPTGTITGLYLDASFVIHGFIRIR